MFTQSHYYGTVSENVTLGGSILKVTATDSDDGENGQIIYMLHSKQQSGPGSTGLSNFAINRQTGWIYVSKPLDFESHELHELVVIARDMGTQPLETSALVSIRVTDVNDNQPTVNLLFLTANSKPEIFEDAKIGDLIARISVNDADKADTFYKQNNARTATKRHSTGLNVRLFGAPDGEFVLRSTDQTVYLLVVNSSLDREKRSKYQLSVVVNDHSLVPLNTTTTFELDILDVNDNAPYFEQNTFYATLPEATDIGSSVFQMNAVDLDSDSLLTYAFMVSSTDYSDDDDVTNDDQLYFGSINKQNQSYRLTTKTAWFNIDRRSGLIVTRTQVDCETDSEPMLTVIATDSSVHNVMQQQSISQGYTATATLIVSISDVSKL